MEDKYKSNGYLSEASFNQDQQKLAGMQSSAQKSMEQLEASMQQQYMEAQKIVNDSIQKFIEVYNAQHGYDAILLKAATLYINPDLDITDEVVEGLNARYNKVKK
jgi:outer membrane protein